MSWPHIILFVLTLLVMLIGLLGVILPVLPGIPMIFGATLVYAILTDFTVITARTVIVFGVLAILSLILDWIATAFGVKRMGGSYMGILGAFLGMIIGLIIPGIGIFGFVICSFVGAFAFEMIRGKESREAMRAGFGSFIGFLIGGVLRFVIGATMIGVFIWKILF
jgi:uncharacterized protein YqgC (DUF456 family)